MSKSILVVDTPKSCSECDYCGIKLDEEVIDYAPVEYWCKASKLLHTTYAKSFRTNRHPKCPLQDTTELLKAFELDKREVCGKYEDTFKYSIVMNNVYHIITEETYDILNKLRNALGGKQ